MITLFIILASKVIFGGLAGYLASRVMKDSSISLIGYVILGIIGSFVGDFTLGLVGLHLKIPFIGALLRAVIGSVLVLFLVGLFDRKK